MLTTDQREQEKQVFRPNRFINCSFRLSVIFVSGGGY